MLELLSQMSPGSQNNEPKDEDVVVEEPQAAYSKHIHFMLKSSKIVR